MYNWEKKACFKCDVCDSVQSVNHLIYECPYVKHIWNIIEMSLGIHIDFKLLLIGIDKNSHLNELLSIIVYCIYKEWLHQSFENHYRDPETILKKLKYDLYAKNTIYQQSSNHKWPLICLRFTNIIDALSSEQ